MKILALEREHADATAHDFKRLAKSEAARAWELYQEGVIRELYFRQDRPEAVLLLECTGAVEAAAPRHAALCGGLALGEGGALSGQPLAVVGGMAHNVVAALDSTGIQTTDDDANKQKPAKEGTVEAWGRSPDNPIDGWYGLKKGLRGRFGVYIPLLMEALSLCELERHYGREVPGRTARRPPSSNTTATATRAALTP